METAAFAWSGTQKYKPDAQGSGLHSRDSGKDKKTTSQATSACRQTRAVAILHRHLSIHPSIANRKTKALSRFSSQNS